MSQPALANSAISQVAIMVRANEKWVAAGMPKNDADRFWSEAEQELRQEAAEQEDRCAVADRSRSKS
jgi:hypothetical protein